MKESHREPAASRAIGLQRCLWPLLLHFAALFAAVPAVSSTADPLLSLRDALLRSGDEAALRQHLKAVAWMVEFALLEHEDRHGGRRFTVAFRSQVAPRRLCGVMGWERAYAVPPHVDEGSWRLHPGTPGLDDRLGPPVATRSPQVGVWVLEPVLDRGPQGRVRELLCDGSPAEDPTPRDTPIVMAIHIEARAHEWHEGEVTVIPRLPPFFTATTSLRASSPEVIRSWIEARKGDGRPQYADVVHADLRVFAAWNIPSPGFNATYYWVYCPVELGLWGLVESAMFLPSAEPAESVVLDPESNELRFVGRRGQIYHRVLVGTCPRAPAQVRHSRAEPPA